jgi:toxin-antitoxin system PIN domain toxin
MKSLPDVNVWVALAFEAHAFHLRAKAWFDATSVVDCQFCRMTQQGFLRLATNPRAVGSDAVSLVSAWRLYDEFMVDSRVTFASEPLDLESDWRSLTADVKFSPKVWNDAYLVAFASGIGAELVTFDKGFVRYQGKAIQILS